MLKFIKHFMTVGIITGITGFICICSGQYKIGELTDTMPYQKNPSTKDGYSSTELGEHVSIKENENTILVELLGVFGLDNSIEKGKDLKFIDYARAIINMALGLVAFIALIMSIYTFYMMFFSENEAGIKKAKGNLVGIFIALAILGLAWIIVSFIFRWYQSNWKDEEKNLFPESPTSFNYDYKTIKNQIYLTI